MKQLFTFLLLVSSVWAIYAQQTLSLKDATLGATGYLRPDMPEQITWRDSRHVLMIKESNLCDFNVEKKKETNILSISQFNTSLKDAGFNEVTLFPKYALINASTIWFQLQNKLVIYNLNERKVTEMLGYPQNADNFDFCPNTSTLAYTIKNNLFVVGKNGEKQITNDIQEHVVNGTSVHRNEFGINKGTFWSPDGNKIAFYRMDESMVGDYPLVNYMTREAELVNIKYPMAGMASHQVKVGIFDLTTQQTVFMQTGEQLDHYLTNICWSPDGNSIFIQELNREQNHMQLNQYDSSTGKRVKTILEETDAKYVEPLNPIVFSRTEPNKFYYQSRKDGWNHVYECSIDRGFRAQITKGNWEVTKLAGFDASGENMFFEATKESPVERHFYKINLGTGVINKLTREAGTHVCFLAPDCSFVIDRWTDTDVPGQLDLVSVNKPQSQTLYKSVDTLKDFDLGENTIFTIKAADGTTDLYCRMIKPNHFDPGKKYPVIVYVYGGPHDQLINRTWKNQARWWQYYMASKGYIAFTVDSRGSANRGKAFEDVIHRQLGITETADQMKGIEYLKSLPYVDQNRIGVHGWSYGGFMTLNLKLKHPEIFKVAVAGGPVVDWSMYEVMYGERYMDTPQENPDGYEKANMLNYADRLSGKLLIIHGVQDQTVVMQHSIKFLKKCIDLNKQIDFFVYPTHEHNVRGDDRLHLMEKISNYFIDNL